MRISDWSSDVCSSDLQGRAGGRIDQKRSRARLQPQLTAPVETMMSKRSLTLALALPALLVAGCGGTVNRGLESVHQPVVSRADYAFDLSTANGHLAPGEAQRLDGWLASLNVG